MTKAQLDELKGLAEWSWALEKAAVAEVGRQERAAERRRAWVGVAIHLACVALGLGAAVVGLPAGSGWGWVGAVGAAVNAVMLTADVANLILRGR